ncbi:MAG TPA: tetratricopeptide repeat protein [Thermoanaerobaculia bacterium]|nr:tetratricopeptide repeat protein [Thermoanaerobaculia bacterium]
MNDFSPPGPVDVRTWPVWNVLRFHAAVVVENANQVGVTTLSPRLMSHLALLLYAKGLYVEAEPLMRRAVEILETKPVPDHNLATALDNLAQLLQATNQLVKAEPLMRRALKINEDSYGPNHPNVAIRLNNLASLLQDTNRLAEAEPLMQRA